MESCVYFAPLPASSPAECCRSQRRASPALTDTTSPLPNHSLRVLLTPCAIPHTQPEGHNMHYFGKILIEIDFETYTTASVLSVQLGLSLFSVPALPALSDQLSVALIGYLYPK